MERLGDVSCGDWLRERIGDRDWGRVGDVAGAGFEAYARILHPVPAHRVDLAVTDRWGMHPVLEEETLWPWSEVAGRQELTMHPLVQWNRLADIHDGIDFADGWRVGQTREGDFEAALLAGLVEHLQQATVTPEELVVGVWDGWGELDVAACAGPLLELPGRDYLLLTARSAELADETWPSRTGIWSKPMEDGPAPQLIWPADHAWVVASEIDWDSTIVAGSRELVDAVLADGRFEAYEVGEGSDLTWEGDRINPPRDGWSAGS